jgi:lipoprotein NlpI
MIASLTRATAVLPILAIAGACLAAQAGDFQLCHENPATNPDVAIRACTAAIGSGQLSGADRAGASLDRGIAYLHKENYDLAIRDFDQAIRGQPDLAAAFDRRC